jgi:hypothetical protein
MIKRIEHYWKGLSAPRTQISAIPPQAYGDRFVNFITGITMTKEEAQRRETQESHRVGEQIPVQSASAENLSPLSNVASPTEHESPAVEKTMRKAQKQADKATSPEKGRYQSEEEKPDRTLKTTEDTRVSMTLPIVSESGESGESSVNQKRALSPPDEAEEEEHEKTPTRSSSIPTSSSVPGLRKVSPSTFATATDTGEDDTSISSPQTHAADLESDFPEDDDDYSKQSTEMEQQASQKPPRIASDLIQPQSPLEDSVFRSLDHQLREPTHAP